MIQIINRFVMAGRYVL